MNERQTETLRKIEGEISACFSGWDSAINRGRQPVPIQDLDYWSSMIKAVLFEEEVLQYKKGV